MANLCITRSCRRGCNYCFAKHELARDAAIHMPPEVYEAALAFLERSSIPEARLLGGEPTEHPRFCEYAELARKRGLRVMVFSGGLIPQPALEQMAAWPAEAVTVVLNTADPASDSKALVKRQLEVCRALGSKVMLGINIRSPDQDPRYIFDWVSQYGLVRNIRVGIAHPIWGGTNDFFRQRGPREIPVLEALVSMGAKLEVNVGFDCGFTPCMFSLEFVDAHSEIFLPGITDPGTPVGSGESTPNRTGMPGSKHAPANIPSCPTGESAGRDRGATDIRMEAIGVRCHPVVDVLPEGDCIACYALSRFRRVPLPTVGVYGDVVSSLENELVPVLPLGVHRECAHCGYRTNGLCSGGCRARRAFRLRPDASVPLCSEPAGGLRQI
jgi:hypothetical protein